jgi:hypothetical protein
MHAKARFKERQKLRQALIKVQRLLIHLLQRLKIDADASTARLAVETIKGLQLFIDLSGLSGEDVSDLFDSPSDPHRISSLLTWDSNRRRSETQSRYRRYRRALKNLRKV